MFLAFLEEGGRREVKWLRAKLQLFIKLHDATGILSNIQFQLQFNKPGSRIIWIFFFYQNIKIEADAVSFNVSHW